MTDHIVVNTTINGEPTVFLANERDSLLEALRDRIGLTGAKEGCNNGNCGACCVNLDGRIVNACLVMAAEVEGSEVRTVEGPGGRRPALAAAERLPRRGGAAVRHLHAGFPGRRRGAAGAEPRPDGARNPLLAGGQPLPLHGLRQDHPRSAARRARK